MLVVPSAETIKHMVAARLTRGERFIIANGRGQGFILELAEDIQRRQHPAHLYVKPITKVAAEEKPVVTLVQGLAASERMDLVVRQATELGVSRILPLASERSQIHLAADAAKRKLERWQRIAQAAAEQSQQLVCPEITLPLSLEEALAATSSDAVRICCWEESEHGSIRTVLSGKSAEMCAQAGGASLPSVCPYPSVALFIGPEGGFSSEEVAAMRTAGACVVSLGSTILRTETAATVATALVLSELGMLGSVPERV